MLNPAPLNRYGLDRIHYWQIIYGYLTTICFISVLTRCFYNYHFNNYIIAILITTFLFNIEPQYDTNYPFAFAIKESNLFHLFHKAAHYN